MIDLEKLYAYRKEFELEHNGTIAQITELQHKLVFIGAEISVVEKMIVDEEKAQEQQTCDPEINEENTRVEFENYNTSEQNY